MVNGLFVEAAGGTIYRPSTADKRAFREAAGGMRGWYTRAFGDTWLIRLDKAVAACERREAGADSIQH